MSTRGFVIFVADNEAKTSYNHWDSGPRDLGIKVLHWLRAERDQPDRLRAAITSLKVVSDDGPPPTAEEVSRLHEYSDPGANSADEWYALLRGTQGDPAAILASGYVWPEQRIGGDADCEPRGMILASRTWEVAIAAGVSAIAAARATTSAQHHARRRG